MYMIFWSAPTSVFSSPVHSPHLALALSLLHSFPTNQAEVLALAKRMLRRREKESIVDAAYNRYAFHDTHLPRWFTDDERRHMR